MSRQVIGGSLFPFPIFQLLPGREIRMQKFFQNRIRQQKKQTKAVSAQNLMHMKVQ